MTRVLLRWLCVVPLCLAVPIVATGQDVRSGADADQLRFERQLHANPFDPAALNNLAVVKASQGQLYEARDLLERAARLAPDSAEIRGNLDRLSTWQRGAGADGRSAAGGSKLPPEPPALWSAKPASR